MQPSIIEALAAISNHKPIAQKSEEWLIARKNLIAASESGYLLGIRSSSSMMNYIKAKCNLTTSLNNLGKLESVRHGNIYEDVARAIYQSRHSLEVKEYGLITTSKNSFLGASPDGIVIRHAESRTESRVGRLVEIKNPYDFDPSDTIKPEYAVQILQQQFVLDLHKCDFVKTNIIGSTVNQKTATKGLVPYRDIDAFLEDVLQDATYLPAVESPIPNKNIPRGNLTSKGMEKGILIHYKDTETGQYIMHLYPLSTPYTKTSILEWIKTTKETISSSTGICKSNIAIEYWYLAAYFEKTLEYDAKLFENIYLPRLELVWQLIKRIRELQDSYTILSSSSLSSRVISDFIDNVIKLHLNRPSKFYKDANNQTEICKLLETALLLDIEIKNHAKIEKQISNLIDTLDTKDSITENKYEPKAKNRSKVKNKIMIEYDF
jgi:putative phage-type endonuclease